MNEQLVLGECPHRWSKSEIIEEHRNMYGVIASVLKRQTCTVPGCGATRQYIDFGVKRTV